jgi:hypothetical protein
MAIYKGCKKQQPARAGPPALSLRGERYKTLACYEVILYCSILLHSSIYYNFYYSLSATIIQLKSFKTFLKLYVKS